MSLAYGLLMGMQSQTREYLSPSRNPLMKPSSILTTPFRAQGEAIDFGLVGFNLTTQRTFTQRDIDLRPTAADSVAASEETA